MSAEFSPGKENTGSPFLQRLGRLQQESGETTWAMEESDRYRKNLDVLEQLLAAAQKGQSVETVKLDAIAATLNTLQAGYRLEFMYEASSVERVPMADLLNDTATILEKSKIAFPTKEKLLKNTKEREPVIRSGKEPPVH